MNKRERIATLKGKGKKRKGSRGGKGKGAQGAKHTGSKDSKGSRRRAKGLAAKLNHTPDLFTFSRHTPHESSLKTKT